MEYLWAVFCGDSDCLCNGGKACSTSGFLSIIYPSSCINHVVVICLDIVLLLVLSILTLISSKPSSRGIKIPTHLQRLEIFSAIFNSGLGLVYFGLGIWVLGHDLRKENTVLPLHGWLVWIFKGCTWFFLGFTVSVRGRLCSIIACLHAGLLSLLSLLAVIYDKQGSFRILLDVFSLPGAILLLLLCTYKGNRSEENGEAVKGNDLYTPLHCEANGSDKIDPGTCETPFAKAGFISRMSFWWLNPLMKLGQEKTIEDEDIPQLRKVDRAETCYLLFVEQLNRLKQTRPSTPPSILWTIVGCYWKEILISGFFAFRKILTVSVGPLLLKSFIEVAEGKEAFKHEGYVLAISLFFAKCLESLAQRQWYFRSRIIGIQVRSLLSAAIYKKQLRLSNAAKMMHSAGEIMNYVTVDAYRIGEFPFWFHQTWTTSLQLCFALVILVRAVGFATIASLIVILLTVLCNAPLAKLQHRFQTKLMVVQDDRRKATSEALVNMKVLKLYAWESHFKHIIEELRKEEYKWFSAVQLRRAYNSFLFWSSPLLVSTATFGACYLLGIPLYASNVFTFVATLRLVQDPVRTIPEVIGAVIQAKVALARIIKFLEAPELQSGKVRQKRNTEDLQHAIIIESANLSWGESLSKPTLRNINLEVKHGEKIAICGEVGAGKSTLLTAVLGEVPNIEGMDLLEWHFLMVFP